MSNLNSEDIVIFMKTHSTVNIQCNEQIGRELYNYFSAFALNYMWSPKYKAKVWDGKIRFFTFSTNELPIGLVEKLYEFARTGNYTIKCTYERFNNIERNEFYKFVDSLNITDSEGQPMIPRDYQLEAAYQAITKKILNVEASTSSGKSLIIYIICRFMKLIKSKVLLVCPTTQLVEQMFKDFQEYGWDSEKYCHRIYSGQRKYYDAPITITTWQSMVSTKIKLDNPYQDFGTLIIDEAHGAGAKSITDLSKVCINADYRVGFSGTYPESTIADWYSIVGSLGPIQTFATYKMLQDNGYISKLKIYNIILNYKSDFKKQLYNEFEKDFAGQGDMINANPDRNQFILKMLQNLKENTMCLVTKKDKHGIPLFEFLKENLKGKMLLYVDGDVPVSEREDVRRIMAENNNVVLVATYQSFSTGTNIKNLHNICFLAGYKKRTKTFQAIGRSLRLHKSKEYAKLFDFVDNCSFIDRANNIKFINYSMDHYKERAGFYETEGWNVKSIKYQI